ncbi:unnamed protein product [Sphagnum balticum]
MIGGVSSLLSYIDNKLLQMVNFSSSTRSGLAFRFAVILILLATLVTPWLAALFVFRLYSSSTSPLLFDPFVLPGLPRRTLDARSSVITACVESASKLKKGGRAGELVVATECSCRSVRENELERVIQQLETKERSQAFERIYSTDYWGGGESRSGPGSNVLYTANARKLLAEAFQKFGVHLVLDVPCGDVNWQPLIEGFNYTKYVGYDIVPQLVARNIEHFRECKNMEFARHDFVNMPIDITPDLIICRDAIQHNTLKDGVRALANLEKSGAKYLVTNWHTNTGRGMHIPANKHNFHVSVGGAYPIDVSCPPFNFSNPELFISEGPNGENDDGKFIGVWKLPAMLKGNGERFIIPDNLKVRAKQKVVFWDEVLKAQDLASI